VPACSAGPQQRVFSRCTINEQCPTHAQPKALGREGYCASGVRHLPHHPHTLQRQSSCMRISMSCHMAHARILQQGQMRNSEVPRRWRYVRRRDVSVYQGSEPDANGALHKVSLTRVVRPSGPCCEQEHAVRADQGRSRLVEVSDEVNMSAGGGFSLDTRLTRRGGPRLVAWRRFTSPAHDGCTAAPCGRLGSRARTWGVRE
jgi:hypothetical protein